MALAVPMVPNAGIVEGVAIAASPAAAAQNGHFQPSGVAWRRQPGAAASPDAASPAAAARTMTGEQVRRKQLRKAKITILDTRSSIDGDVIDGAYNVTPDLVSAWAARVPKSTLIVAYCTCEDDGLSIQAVEALQQMGFKNAFVLKGGLDAARAAGVPMGRLAG